MKKLPTLLASAFVLSIIIYSGSCSRLSSTEVNLDITKDAFERLSEYNFFSGELKSLKPNERVTPYDLITPLYTDYAHKSRFVYVPLGKSAAYDTAHVLQFPVGSCLIKNFYYPFDFRDETKGRRIMETRMLVHKESGWVAMDYIWNDEQTEAMLDNTGAIKPVSWIHYDGTKRSIDYVVPTKTQCKSCHWSNAGDIIPIGPRVRNLNRDFDYGTGPENQLAHFAKEGIVSNMPAPDACPKMADWKDSLHYTVEQRARAYLDVNCGHCHNPKGPAYTSGLHLNWDNYNLEHLGFCKSPVAAGKATGGRLYDITPGSPDASILVFRVETNDPGIKMPEIGRNTLHTEGVSLLRQWIAEMKPDACKMQ